MPYQAILLDFYGTLVAEDDHVIASICSRVAESLGDPLAATAFGQRWSEVFSRLCRESFGASFRTQRAIELESLQRVLAEFSVQIDPEETSEELYRYWRRPQPFPESAAFLAACPVPICFVSNIDTEDLVEAVRHQGWKVSAFVTSESAQSYKPRSEIFEGALCALGLSAAEVLHVGDSLSADIAGGVAVGIATAWINRKGRSRNPNAPVPTYEIRTLTELRTILLADTPKGTNASGARQPPPLQ